jgi:PHD/YefM family antitoxin component YafN of YafNO toxin-antitoxin module
MPYPSVRYIGSRELHRDLPKVLESLEDPSARFVLTIHSKPKAVLIGAEAFLALLKGHTPQDRILALQLGALVRGLEASADSDDDPDPDDLPEAEDELRQGLVVAAV